MANSSPRNITYKDTDSLCNRYLDSQFVCHYFHIYLKSLGPGMLYGVTCQTIDFFLSFLTVLQKGQTPWCVWFSVRFAMLENSLQPSGAIYTPYTPLGLTWMHDSTCVNVSKNGVALKRMSIDVYLMYLFSCFIIVYTV